MYKREVKSLETLSENNINGVVKLLAAEKIKVGYPQREKGLILTDFYETNLLEELKIYKYKPS